MNFLVWTYFFTCGISRRKKRRGKLRQSISFFLFYKGWVSIFIISRRESVDSRFFDSMVRLILAALFYHSSRNALTQKLDRCTQTNPVQSVSVVINGYSCDRQTDSIPKDLQIVICFIHTEIHSLKYYRSCLLMDEECILKVVLFQSISKKSQFVWNINIILLKVLERF